MRLYLRYENLFSYTGALTLAIAVLVFALVAGQVETIVFAKNIEWPIGVNSSNIVMSILLVGLLLYFLQKEVRIRNIFLNGSLLGVFAGLLLHVQNPVIYPFFLTVLATLVRLLLVGIYYGRKTAYQVGAAGLISCGAIAGIWATLFLCIPVVIVCLLELFAAWISGLEEEEDPFPVSGNYIRF